MKIAVRVRPRVRQGDFEHKPNRAVRENLRYLNHARPATELEPGRRWIPSSSALATL
jgi:hypothetical protein